MNLKRKQIFSTTATPEEDRMRQEVEEAYRNGAFSADDIKQMDEFAKVMSAAYDYLKPHFHLCAKPDIDSYNKFIDLLVGRVDRLDAQTAHTLVSTPTFRNHKIVFERATEPRPIKGEDVPAYRTQLVLLLVAIAGHLLGGESPDEDFENIKRAVHIGYIFHYLEQLAIKEAA